jgi:protein-S-isoprenylcysteine O-methyltransferase Ste14
MSRSQNAAQPMPESELRRAVVRRVVQVAIMLLIFGASLFVGSGQWDWVAAWVFLGLYLVMIGANALLLDRELVAERAQIGEDTKDWDRVLASLSLLLWTPGALIVSGLDQRFGWSDVADPLRVACLAVLIAGHALSTWAMARNRFYSGTVRIQEDRGHVVVSSGPYRFVRHPGYVAYLLLALSTPLWLDSLWGLVPSLLGAGAIVVRTWLEDQTLCEELEGYTEYAQRVRYRLVPGIW